MNLSHDDYDWMYGVGKDQGNFFGWLWNKLLLTLANKE